MEWNGYRWKRLGPYWARSIKINGESRTLLLHREIYAKHHGPIPDGWHVHHKDHDKSNNDPSNLEARPKSGPGNHQSQHPKSAEWHAAGGRASKPNPVPLRSCEQCKEPFKGSRRSRFCSKQCWGAFQRSAAPTGGLRSCVVCRGNFERPRNSTAVTCSRRCRDDLSWQRRRAGVGPDDRWGARLLRK